MKKIIESLSPHERKILNNHPFHNIIKLFTKTRLGENDPLYKRFRSSTIKITNSVHDKNTFTFQSSNFSHAGKRFTQIFRRVFEIAKIIFLFRTINVTNTIAQQPAHPHGSSKFFPKYGGSVMSIADFECKFLSNSNPASIPVHVCISIRMRTPGRAGRHAC